MMILTAQQIAKATDSKVEDVTKALPGIYEYLLKWKSSDAFLVAVLATAAVECRFKPVGEYGAIAYFKRYEGRRDLGNLQKGDGYKYRGRGLVQLTGRANYEKYGKLIDVDLINNPDKALEPDTAVKLLMVYMKDHGCDVHANKGDWQKVRRLVNGGLNGWEKFHKYVYQLLALHPEK